MPLCAILKIEELSNQFFKENLFAIHFYYFGQIITLRDLETINNKQYVNIKFTWTSKENGLLSFLYIKISRENNKFMTSFYLKPTFSIIFTNFESSIPEICKRGLIETFLHRSFRLCFNSGNFHGEIETLKTIFEYDN